MKEEIKIPQGIQIELSNGLLKIKGPKGELQRRLLYPGINITKEKDSIILSSKRSSKKEKRIIKTYKSLIKNLLKGVTEGYIYQLKICASHFPMSVTIEKDAILIHNFLGEKIPRKAKLLPGASVKVEGDKITVTGLDKEAVSQSAANIELITRITDKDRRVFQDGCYIISKDNKPIK